MERFEKSLPRTALMYAANGKHAVRMLVWRRIQSFGPPLYFGMLIHINVVAAQKTPTQVSPPMSQWSYLHQVWRFVRGLRKHTWHTGFLCLLVKVWPNVVLECWNDSIRRRTPNLLNRTRKFCPRQFTLFSHSRLHLQDFLCLSRTCPTLALWKQFFTRTSVS
jgi:hypothetical protein